LLAAVSLQAADWPQWRGIDRTGISRETGLLKSWPEGGPKLAWTGRNLGEGHSTPSVSAGKIYGMGLRGEDEVVWALDEKSGKELWSTRIGAGAQLQGQQGGNGPRATPTIDGQLLYVLGAGGEMACLTDGGKIKWQKNLVTDFGGRVPTWGYSESPLIDGDKVIVTPGSRTTSMVALDKLTGETRWKTAIPNTSAGYSSAIIAEVEGQKQYIQLMAGGVVGVNAADGQLAWRFDAPATPRGIVCSTPIYRDGYVFAASGYGHGGGLAKVTKSSATDVYFTRDMKNQHGGMVVVGDYLYGFDDPSTLTCLNFKTGEVKWTNRSVGKGSVAFADGMIYARSERQGIALVEATPNGYVEKGRFDQPERSNAAAWPHPVIANGKLYLRDQGNLFCYDVKQGVP
jgi:outer membrane protein assembly factor BamB